MQSLERLQGSSLGTVDQRFYGNQYDPVCCWGWNKTSNGTLATVPPTVFRFLVQMGAIQAQGVGTILRLLLGQETTFLRHHRVTVLSTCKHRNTVAPSISHDPLRHPFHLLSISAEETKQLHLFPPTSQPVKFEPTKPNAVQT